MSEVIHAIAIIEMGSTLDGASLSADQCGQVIAEIARLQELACPNAPKSAPPISEPAQNAGESNIVRVPHGPLTPARESGKLPVTTGNKATSIQTLRTTEQTPIPAVSDALCHNLCAHLSTGDVRPSPSASKGER